MNSPNTSIDPELISGFKQESSTLLKELTEIVETLENGGNIFPSKLLEGFSQKIDRIMGAAKTIHLLMPDNQDLENIGKIAELCKSLGYKAAEKKLPQYIPIFAAFWSDAIDVIDSLLSSFDDPNKDPKTSHSFSKVLQSRLEWLSVKIGAKEEIQDLTKKLGLLAK